MKMTTSANQTKKEKKQSVPREWDCTKKARSFFQPSVVNFFSK